MKVRPETFTKVPDVRDAGLAGCQRAGRRSRGVCIDQVNAAFADKAEQLFRALADFFTEVQFLGECQLLVGKPVRNRQDGKGELHLFKERRQAALRGEDEKWRDLKSAQAFDKVQQGAIGAVQFWVMDEKEDVQKLSSRVGTKIIWQVLFTCSFTDGFDLCRGIGAEFN